MKKITLTNSEVEAIDYAADFLMRSERVWLLLQTNFQIPQMYPIRSTKKSDLRF